MKWTDKRPHLLWFLCVMSLSFYGVGSSQADELVNPDGLNGCLILAGGGNVPDGVLVELRDAAERGAVLALLEAASDPAVASVSASAWLRENGISNLLLIDPQLPAPERIVKTVEAVQTANVVWIGGGQQERLATYYADSGLESALQGLLQRGGIIAGTSAGAAIMSKVMIASGQKEPLISAGWDLLPGAIVDQHFTERERLERSRAAVQQHPGLWGLGIDEDTAAVVKGRRLNVIGKGRVTALLAATDYREGEVIRLKAGEEADIVQLRRAALQRASGNDPGTPEDGGPFLASGSLVIVGGGSLPEAIVDRFVELAGGSSAQIVVLPTAVPRGEESTDVPRFLKQSNAKSIVVLPQRGNDVESEEFRSALQNATGIWFGGGRQWHFVDSYDGTEAIELFHDVLRRGGVIGGSSAGATIQGEFLVRGHPLGNTVMMAEGYERGFSFLPGAAIDQHFSQRRRQHDLRAVISRHPQMLGIGIDEGTALVVTGSTAEVLGQHSVHFLVARDVASAESTVSGSNALEDRLMPFRSLKSGESVDLKSFVTP